MIDQATIDRIFAAIDIVDVVQDFVSLKKRGVNHQGLCPFHNEKTPSFNVSSAKGIYKCFGCGKGGNAVNFIMEHEHMSYVESLKFLAKKYGIEIVEREQTPEDIERHDEVESMIVVTNYAAKVFKENLHNTDEGRSVALSYFRERGISDNMVDKFELGYSLDGFETFTKRAISEGYKAKYLVSTGMSIEREDGRMFDRFHSRVIFPIHGLSGKVIGFGGRIMKKDEKAAKYLNSPETEIYHKSKVLYGLTHARRAIVQSDCCFLVEGYMDVIAMHQSGIENTVASSGTSLTQEQIRLIKRFTNNLTILYDGDKAGIKASLRGIDLVLEEGLNVKVVLLPDGDDPDSYSKKVSTIEFVEYIDKHQSDFVTFKTNLLLGESKNDPVHRAEVITDIAHSISLIPELIVRAEYIRSCSQMLNVKEDVLHNEINKKRRRESEKRYGKPSTIANDVVKEKTQEQNRQFLTSSRPEERIEREMIRLMIKYGQHTIFSQIEEDELTGDKTEYITTTNQFIISTLIEDELEFLQPVCLIIFNEFRQAMSKNIILEDKYFINHPDELVSQLAIDVLTSNEYGLSKIWEKRGSYVRGEEDMIKELVPETVVAYKQMYIISAIADSRKKLKQAQENNAEEDIKTELLNRILTLTQIKNELAGKMGNRIII